MMNALKIKEYFDELTETCYETEILNMHSVIEEKKGKEDLLDQFHPFGRLKPYIGIMKGPRKCNSPPSLCS